MYRITISTLFSQFFLNSTKKSKYYAFFLVKSQDINKKIAINLFNFYPVEETSFCRNVAEIERFLLPFRLRSDQTNNGHMIIWGETGVCLSDNHPSVCEFVLMVMKRTMLLLILHLSIMLCSALFSFLDLSVSSLLFFGFMFLEKILKCNSNG